MKKPGYKTSEFWLTLLAVLAGAVVASGVLAETASTLDDRVAALIVSSLAAMGYAGARAFTKSGENKLEAAKASVAAQLEATKALSTKDPS